MLLPSKSTDMLQEQIDLEHHVRQIKEEPSSSQNGINSMSTFAVVVKVPCLAVKYLLSNTHVG